MKVNGESGGGGLNLGPKLGTIPSNVQHKCQVDGVRLLRVLGAHQVLEEAPEENEPLR